MRLVELDPLIGSIGLPYAYYAFNRQTAKAPPYLVYYSPGRTDLLADDTNYQHKIELTIELYTKTKRWDLEQLVEATLAEAGLAYGKSEAHVDSDGVFQITYTTEVLINE